jgi:tetratricopeptide (TPR) repeat protein
VLRYADEDDFGKPETAFNFCTFWLIEALYLVGRHDEARAHAVLGLKVSPGPAHRLLAEIALAERDLDTAEREARAALEIGESRLGPYVLFARVLGERGRYEEALAQTDRALAVLAEMAVEDQRFPGLYFVRGDLFARLGDADQAIAAFRREMKDHPAGTRSYTRLAAVYAALGEEENARGVLQEMLDVNPEAPGAWVEAVKTYRVLGDPGAGNRLLAEARRRFPESSALRAL